MVCQCQFERLYDYIQANTQTSSMNQTIRSGARLREHLRRQPITPFIGIYDVFSASLAARHFDALFVSGFSFAASHYGLPDIGFISWPEIPISCSESVQSFRTSTCWWTLMMAIATPRWRVTSPGRWKSWALPGLSWR